jgi:poly-beta-1,6-N-acetyl-D-glucosamine synthase
VNTGSKPEQGLNVGSRKYLLMTAAHNEEAFIEGAIRSVLSQTILPQRWVIVSDNSSDRTDAIVPAYAAQHEFIHFLRIKRPPGRNFGAKVRALHKGCELLNGLRYEFIGNVDGDVSLEPNYFEELIHHFSENRRLGIAGGFIYEDSGHGYISRTVNSVRNVPHAAQLVRRECYEAIGGYAVLKYGGEDWYAQTRARMLGWQVEAFPQLKIFHHRQTGSVSSPVRNSFRLGSMDYSFGSDPSFEFIKCLRRIKDKPYFLVALARMAGFIWPYVSKEQREVAAEFMSFLRREQRERLWSAFRNIPSAQ